jgi:hypothetical protein
MFRHDDVAFSVRYYGAERALSAIYALFGDFNGRLHQPDM